MLFVGMNRAVNNYHLKVPGRYFSLDYPVMQCFQHVNFTHSFSRVPSRIYVMGFDHERC
jgi:hypothetical protein